MATPAEDWASVGQIIGSLFAGGVIGFLALYRSFPRREETEHSKIVARSVGAAFVDRTTSENIASIAEDVHFMRTHVEEIRREQEHEDAITEAMQRLKQAEEERKRLQPPQG